MLTGMLLGVIFYRPIFSYLDKNAQPYGNNRFENYKPDAFNSSIEKTGDTVRMRKEFGFYGTGVKYNLQSYDTVYKYNLKPVAHSKKVMVDKVLGFRTFVTYIFLVWVMIIFVTSRKPALRRSDAYCRRACCPVRNHHYQTRWQGYIITRRHRQP